jgi:hypothetical protein
MHALTNGLGDPPEDVTLAKAAVAIMAEEHFSFVPQKQTRHCSKRSPHPPADCPQQSRARAKSTSPDPTQAGTAAHSHGSAPVAR